MFTEQEQAEYVGQLTAFLHAQVDGSIALIEAKHKQTGEAVILACIVQQFVVPPKILGGPPTAGERIVPIFQFVNPHAQNPYESLDPQMKEIAPASTIVLPDVIRAPAQ